MPARTEQKPTRRGSDHNPEIFEYTVVLILYNCNYCSYPVSLAGAAIPNTLNDQAPQKKP